MPDEDPAVLVPPKGTILQIGAHGTVTGGPHHYPQLAG